MSEHPKLNTVKVFNIGKENYDIMHVMDGASIHKYVHEVSIKYTTNNNNTSGKISCHSTEATTSPLSLSLVFANLRNPYPTNPPRTRHLACIIMTQSHCQHTQ